MNHYQDIEVFAKKGEHPNRVLARLYTQLHLKLVETQSTDIGVSFPRMEKDPGNLLRIHGSRERLESLNKTGWWQQLAESIQCAHIIPTPSGVSHWSISRVRSNMSRSKLRRLQKRGSINKEGVKEYRARMCADTMGQPYVELLSGSNGNIYRRYLQFGPSTNQQVSGAFDVFGLSSQATVPWF